MTSVADTVQHGSSTGESSCIANITDKDKQDTNEGMLPTCSTSASNSAGTTEMSLPAYSSRVADILARGQILMDMNQFIEATAYHIISNGDMTSRTDYENYGKRLMMKYPCLSFPGRKHEWVQYTLIFCITAHNKLEGARESAYLRQVNF